MGASNVTGIQVTCGTLDGSTSLFPIAVPGSDFGVGDLALDNNGDLLVVVSNPARAIVRVNHLSGAQTTVATGIGASSFLLGVAYRAANDMIYAHTDNGQIFAVTPTGTVTPFTTVSGLLHAIAIAPPSFGSFGGLHHRRHAVGLGSRGESGQWRGHHDHGRGRHSVRSRVRTRRHPLHLRWNHGPHGDRRVW